MEYLVIFVVSLFLGVILSICFLKEVKMGHFVLFVASGIATMISTICFLVFKFGFLEAMITIIQTICDLVVVSVMLYVLCLIFELIDFFYKKIKNFVKKLLTK